MKISDISPQQIDEAVRKIIHPRQAEISAEIDLAILPLMLRLEDFAALVFATSSGMAGRRGEDQRAYMVEAARLLLTGLYLGYEIRDHLGVQ